MVPQQRRRRVATVIGVDPFVRRSLAVLGLLAVAAAVYPFLPLAGFELSTYYQVVASGCLLIGLSGVVRHHPARRSGWLLVLGGFVSWVVADLVVRLRAAGVAYRGLPGAL